VLAARPELACQDPGRRIQHRLLEFALLPGAGPYEGPYGVHAYLAVLAGHPAKVTGAEDADPEDLLVAETFLARPPFGRLQTDRPKRSWERLTELEEYEALSGQRVEHLVPVREPLVLISQIQRSGGTLLSQLFDGHPEHARPHEICIGKPDKWDWPPLDLSGPDTWFATLHEPLIAEWVETGFVKDLTELRKGKDPDVFPFVFSLRLQRAIFERSVAGATSEREVLDAYFTSYFNAWLDNHNLCTGPKRAVVGFTPRLAMELGRVERFFGAYPDGLLVSIVRDPRGWYASARRHRKYYADLEQSIGLWRASTEAALEAAGRFRRPRRRRHLRGPARGFRGGHVRAGREDGDRDDARAARPDVQQPADPGELVGGGRPHRHPPGAQQRLPRGAVAGRDRADRAPGGRPLRAGVGRDPGIVRHMSSSRRRLRVLFFAGGPRFYMRQFSSLVTELAARGHEVHVAFQPTKGELEESARQPGVTHGFAPGRADSDGWRSVAWLVRGLGDLARYAHPRYARAPELRERMTVKIGGQLRKSNEFEPVVRRLALRLVRRLSAGPDAKLSERVIRRAARLEQAIPTSPEIDRWIADRAPDVVLATPVVNRASTQVEFLKSARRLGIPAATLVASWDNLTNKGLLKWAPERVFVWNEIQRREAVELHGMPSDRVVATGAQLFDPWFERRPSAEREEFVRRLGLDRAQPYVLYTCSNPAMTAASESAFVAGWIKAVRSGGDERLRRIGIAVRPHPNDLDHWREVDLSRFENVAVWPREGTLPVTDDTRADFFDSLAHSAAVVGINTTAMIEAAIAGKSVLTVLAPGFAQESTLHFDYLLEENGGFLHVASSLDEHVGQLAHVLDEDEAGAERRRRFVESFVRPHGLDRPATPILADAIEELATLPVERWRPSPLRPVLAAEAGLCALAAKRAGGTKRRSARRVGAPAEG
jgi:hypothetical protein